MLEMSLPLGADLLEVVSACHKALNTLEPSVRSKAIRMLLLAFDESESLRPTPPPTAPVYAHSESEVVPANGHLNRRVQYWLHRYEVHQEILARVLDLESDYALIAHLPAESKREQAISCYLITGVQAMLRTGEPKFRDEEAVALCKREGCYDRANHATTRTQLGKRVTGDKESVFTLTSLGLEQAAALVKKMATG